jgi:hypothetical protein
MVEVCLAILVVGFGLLAVFGLFPAGMRSSEDGVADSRSSLFAEQVFSGLRANASKMTDWTVWYNATLSAPGLQDFADDILGRPPSPYIDLYTPGLRNTGLGSGSEKTLTWPVPGEALRFRLQIDNGLSPRVKAATLHVFDGATGTTNWPAVFYTEFYYSGM